MEETDERKKVWFGIILLVYPPCTFTYYVIVCMFPSMHIHLLCDCLHVSLSCIKVRLVGSII